LFSKTSLQRTKECGGTFVGGAAIVIFIELVAPAFADPLKAPTVQYVLDVEITRDSDHSYQVPTRLVYAGRRMRVESVGIVKLIDLDLQQWLPMIPRVRTYWSPETLKKPATDGRRWVGVEAERAEPVGTDTLLGQSVTKYSVRGTIFDVQTPFEGYVWTTAENIVLQVDGIGRTDGVSAPIKVTPVQLLIGSVDTSLLTVPSVYARAGSGDVGWRRYD
jgi:hypothetical protein